MTIPLAELLKDKRTFSGPWDPVMETDPAYQDHVIDKGQFLRGSCTCRTDFADGVKFYACSNIWRGLCSNQAQACGGYCPECFARHGDLVEELAKGLNLSEVRIINAARCERWHGEATTYDKTPPLSTQWSGADWSNAMGGECGEAQNVVKKLRRGESGTPSKKDGTREELLAALGDEIADTILYGDLLANYYGIDLSAAIRRKFNAVSEREGFPERL